MTRKIVLFQINNKKKSIFNLLKKNKDLPNKLKKKCAFKRFKFSCDYSKEQMTSKNNLFNKMFCKFLYTKCGIISLKSHILNIKIKTEQDILNNKKIRTIILGNNIQYIITKAKNKMRIRKIISQYNEYVAKQNYIKFFKYVAISMQKRSIYKQQMDKMNQIYLINLVKRTIVGWGKYTKYQKNLRIIMVQRMIIGKIFIDKLKINLYEQRKIGQNYNQLLLKKYYFNRLRRTTHYIINYRIAKLKFISKYIFLWKEIANKTRINKFNGIVLFSQIYEKLQKSYFSKMKKIFYIKLNQKNNYLLKLEINTKKVQNFQNYLQNKNKKIILQEFKYNSILRKIQKKKNISLKRQAFEIIKKNKNNVIPMKIKKTEADKLYIKHMKNVIKKCLNNWRYLSNETTIKINEMRNKINKRKIFYFLRTFRFVNKKRSLKISIKFRTYFLYYNFFNMLKSHTKIMKRENNIVKGVQRLMKENELDSKYWAFKSLYNNMLVEKFIKQKNLRLKTKIFYIFKMLCG